MESNTRLQMIRKAYMDIQAEKVKFLEDNVLPEDFDYMEVLKDDDSTSHFVPN